MIDSKWPMSRSPEQLRNVAPEHARYLVRQIEAERSNFQCLRLLRDQLDDSCRASRLAPVEIRSHHFDFRKIARRCDGSFRAAASGTQEAKEAAHLGGPR